MGDAFIAVASSNEALYLNLAGMATAEKYEVDGAYALNKANDLSRFNVSVVDSKTARVAAGVAYTKLTGAGADGSTSGSIGHLGFAYNASDNASLGLGVKYLAFSVPEPINAVTADAGLLIHVGEWVSLGAAIYNFVDIQSREAPLSAGAGAAIGNDSIFRISFDTTFDLSREDATPTTIHAGGEYLLGGAIPLRLGFKRLEQQNQNYLGVGLGFVSMEFGADVALQQNLARDASIDRTLSFTLKVFL